MQCTVNMEYLVSMEEVFFLKTLVKLSFQQHSIRVFDFYLCVRITPVNGYMRLLSITITTITIIVEVLHCQGCQDE